MITSSSSWNGPLLRIVFQFWAWRWWSRCSVPDARMECWQDVVVSWHWQGSSFTVISCIQCGITPMCDSIVTKNAHWQWMHLLGSKKVISYQIAIWLPKCNLWSTRCILWSTQAYNVHFLVNDDVHLVCGLHLVTTNIGMSLLLTTLLFCKNSGSSGAISFWSWFHHRWQPTVHCTGAGSEKHYVTLACNHMTFHVIQRCLPHNL